MLPLLSTPLGILVSVLLSMAHGAGFLLFLMAAGYLVVLTVGDSD